MGKYDGKVGICDNCLPVLGLVALGQGINTADITAETLAKPQEPLMALRKAAKQVSDVASSQTALATGDVDIIVGGGGWLTAVLAKDNPNLDRTILKQGGLRWAQSIGAVDWRGGWHDQARPGTGVPAMYRFPRRSGAACAVLLLLRHARQPESRRSVDARGQGRASLGPAVGRPETLTALPPS